VDALVLDPSTTLGLRRAQPSRVEPERSRRLDAIRKAQMHFPKYVAAIEAFLKKKEG
jgi:hypothetical protein